MTSVTAYYLLHIYYILHTTYCALLTTHYLLPSNLELTSKVAKEMFDAWVDTWIKYMYLLLTTYVTTYL